MALWLLIGAALAGVCVAAPLRWAVAAMIFVMPMSGTATMMLGKDPLLLPLVCSLGFLARTAFSLLIADFRGQFLGILRTDWPMLAFAAYCAITGILNPRFFEGATYINPQDSKMRELLGPWSVQIPQIIYLLFGVALYLAFRHAILRVGLKPPLYAIMIQAVAFGGLGLLQALLGLGGVLLPLDWIVNNEGGSIMSAVFVQGGFVRVSSVFLESSSCAAWGAGAIAFLYGVYINHIQPVRTFLVLGGMGLMMLLSTSSTAYAGLAALAGFALVHSVLDPERQRRERGLVLIIIFAMAAGIGSVVALSADDSGVLGRFREMLLDFTVNKSTSDSAAERTYWADLAVQNAVDTHYLGVGYGAARSSGLFHGLFGTIGVPGLILFAMAFGPLMLHAFERPRTGEDAVRSAGAFGLFVAFATLGVSGAEMGMANLLWALAAIANAPLKERRALMARQSAGETPPSESQFDVKDPAPA